MHPKVALIWVRTHDLQIMTVLFMPHVKGPLIHSVTDLEVMSEPQSDRIFGVLPICIKSHLKFVSKILIKKKGSTLKCELTSM